MLPVKPHPQTPPTVLVVEDDPNIVDMLTSLLARQGMAVLSAYSGRQCLQVVHQHTVDVIVLDVMMPEMSGLEVCATLKQMLLPYPPPIILFTAKDDLETRLEGIRLGVSEFVTKPVNNQELLARIQTQLETGRKTREMEWALANPDEGFPKPKEQR
jgi:two-component system, sensor histidine kinase and response regulator